MAYQPIGTTHERGGGAQHQWPDAATTAKTSLTHLLDEARTAAEPPAHKYGTFTAYCFSVNYVLGVGILGIPWGFVKAGLVLSPLVLLVVSILSFVTVIFVLDTMARAQALFAPAAVADVRSTPSCTQALCAPLTASQLDDGLLNEPVAAVGRGSGDFALGAHKYEMNELVGLFLGRSAQRCYELTVALYLVGALWSYSSVFASYVAPLL